MSAARNGAYKREEQSGATALRCRGPAAALVYLADARGCMYKQTHTHTLCTPETPSGAAKAGLTQSRPDGHTSHRAAWLIPYKRGCYLRGRLGCHQLCACCLPSTWRCRGEGQQGATQPTSKGLTWAQHVYKTVYRLSTERCQRSGSSYRGQPARATYSGENAPYTRSECRPVYVCGNAPCVS